MKTAILRYVFLASISFLLCPFSTLAAGKYVLAFWRELGAYENQAPPAGEFGNHSAFIHVWDENGQSLPGKQILNAYGTVVAVTQPAGYEEYGLPKGINYAFRVKDGARLSEVSPAFSTDRPPNWGHYSIEIGFVFMEDANSSGPFDTSALGAFNAQGDQPCTYLDAPHARSLAYSSTLATDYCSDAHGLGEWANFHGQTFVANGNRIVAVKAFMAAGFGVQHYWTVQIHEGGPHGPPIGPPRTSRLHLDQEYIQILVKWGLDDVQVIPGRTYFMKVSRPGGLNAFRVDRNNYSGGNYYENTTSRAGSELMGFVVCANVTNPGPKGTLSGTIRNPQNILLSGAEIVLPDLGLYGVSSGNGDYTIPDIPVGNHALRISKPGYISLTQAEVVINSNLTTILPVSLELNPNDTGGVTTNGSYVFYPFEANPAWTSEFDADWGSGADFVSVFAGQTGKALQGHRGGQGSSARVLVFDILPNTDYAFAIWMRCPSFSCDYSAECAFQLGSHSAQGLDGNVQSWTMVKKFSDNGVNGNANVWTRYAMSFNSGDDSKISVGFKLWAHNNCAGPIVGWDELSLIPLGLPEPVLAVADSRTNGVLIFSEAVNEIAATTLGNYWLAGPNGSIPLLSASLTNATEVRFTTAASMLSSDCSVTVSNVPTGMQPPNFTGSNGQVNVRIPAKLFSLSDPPGWKYQTNGVNLSFFWRLNNHDDAAWPQGAGLIGHPNDALPFPLLTPLEPNPNRVTTYFRKSFLWHEAVQDAAIRLRIIIDDGAVFWLNNRPLLVLGLPNAIVQYNTPATRVVETATLEGPFYQTGVVLNKGNNVTAVELHQFSPASADVAFDAELEALVYPSQLPPRIHLMEVLPGNHTLRFEWPGPDGVLEYSTNLPGPWFPLLNAKSPVSLPTTNGMTFYRLRL